MSVLGMVARCLLAVALAIPAAGCIAVKLPAAVREGEWEAIRDRLSRDRAGVLLIEALHHHHGLPPLAGTLGEAGPFREVLVAEWDGAGGNVPADWIIRHEGTWLSEGARTVLCINPIVPLTLGIVPQWETWESMDIYGVARADAPDRPLAWIGVPGEQGYFIGLFAVLVSALPDWEMGSTARGSHLETRKERMLIDLSKIVDAQAEGRVPETDPEVLDRLRQIVERRASREARTPR